MKSHVTVAFAGHSVRIACPDEAVYDAVQFMFRPHTINSAKSATSRLTVETGKSSDRFNLTRGKDRLTRNRKLADLFIALYDAVIHDVISPASEGLALHAGAVFKGKTTILIPGVSGAGKSTLTSWFISGGWDYLTDELAYLVDRETTEYLTRPLSIKTGSVDTVRTLFDHEEDDKVLYRSTQGIYLHHSVLNAAESSGTPARPTIILFPAWKKDADYRLERLTVAHCATRLMNVLVNARNLPRHGVPEIIRLASSTPAYRLHYSGFDQIGELEEHLASAPGPENSNSNK
jgi:hypothetical protein